MSGVFGAIRKLIWIYLGKYPNGYPNSRVLSDNSQHSIHPSSRPRLHSHTERMQSSRAQRPHLPPTAPKSSNPHRRRHRYRIPPPSPPPPPPFPSGGPSSIVIYMTSPHPLWPCSLPLASTLPRLPPCFLVLRVASTRLPPRRRRRRRGRGGGAAAAAFLDRTSPTHGISPCAPWRGRLSHEAPQDFHDSRLGRPFVKVYEQESYGKGDVLSAAEKCMKKYADNLLRSLEGITSRLSQLEIYCYKLERSIGELRGDVLRDETDLRLKSLEKHLHEVHRSIQILRDKQELTETQKELAKFQLTQDTSKKKEHVPTPSFTEPKKLEEKPDAAGQQLALVLPQQVNSRSLEPRASEPVQQYRDQLVQQPPPSSLVPQQDRYVLRQAIVYYPQRQASGIQDTQGQQVQPDVQYLPARPPAQDVPVHASSQQPQAVNQTQPQSFPPYQQQWHQQSSQPAPAPVVQPQQTISQPFPPPVQQPQLSNAQWFPPQPVHQPQLSNAQQFSSPPVQPQQSNPQLPPQAMQPQHPPVQTQVRPQTPPNYPHYPPHQPLNPAPETLPGSAPMQGPYNTVAPSGASRSEVSYSYGGPGIPPSQPPPQHNMKRQQLPPPSQGSFGPPPSKGVYAGPPQYAPQGNSQGYNTGYGYPPSGPSAAQAPHMPPGGVGMNHPGSHMMRGHPYGEMIEKAITMGYPRDQVLNVIQRMTESGQPVDFNTLLDRLNEAGSRAHPRVW